MTISFEYILHCGSCAVEAFVVDILNHIWVSQFKQNYQSIITGMYLLRANTRTNKGLKCLFNRLTKIVNFL